MKEIEIIREALELLTAMIGRPEGDNATKDAYDKGIKALSALSELDQKMKGEGPTDDEIERIADQESGGAGIANKSLYEQGLYDGWKRALAHVRDRLSSVGKEQGWRLTEEEIERMAQWAHDDVGDPRSKDPARHQVRRALRYLRGDKEVSGERRHYSSEVNGSTPEQPLNPNT